MNNIFSYIKEYGEYTFSEKEFNDVDNLVFCSLSYLNFSDTSINIKNHTLEYIGNEYFKLNDFKDIKRLGIPQKNGYLLLEEVIKLRRYKNVIFHDYVYSANIDKQFSAMMFKLTRDLEYMCFEGTDELVSGWKEDFELSYKFPIPSQIDAIKYANKHIKMTGANVIIGGHSKGGNLALVAAMYTKQYKQFRVKKVYSNDGPGLRLKEFKSGEYRRIKRKYKHIVPDYSMVGIILRNDVYNVIKTTKKSILSHAVVNWVVEGDHLVDAELSESSKNLEQKLLTWLINHTDKEKESIVRDTFEVFEEANIGAFVELNNFTNIKKVIINLKNIDETTKDMLIDFFKFIISDNEIVKTIKKYKEKLENI